MNYQLTTGMHLPYWAPDS